MDNTQLHLVELPRQIAIFALCSAFGQAETQTQEFSHVINEGMAFDVEDRDVP